MINQIHQHNVLDTPWPLADESVDCCITSPPYWGLRDYGIAGQIGFELNPEYIRIAEDRLKKEFGMFHKIA